MQVSSRFIRPIGTSLVAVFLVGGAAFATSNFVGGGARMDDGVPAADQATESPSETAESTFEAEETPELETESPSASPENETELETESPSASPDDDANETAEPSDDHDDDDGDDNGGSGGSDD